MFKSRIGIFLFFLLAIALKPAISQEQTYQSSPNDGIWYGEMEAGQRVFRFFVTVKQDDDGNWQTELESVDEGKTKFQLSDLTFNESEFSFEIKASRASYTGKIDPATREISGQWSQAGGTFDLNFTPVEETSLTAPDEVWSGQLNVVVQKLDLQIRIYHQPDGEHRVYFDSVSQKAGGFKANFSESEDQVTIEVPMVGGKFVGTRNESGSEIVGKWDQGIPFDLTLRKSEQPTEAATPAPRNRPQHPTPPFPYKIVEVQYRNDDADVDLYGTLTLPQASDANEKFPVAILISGSGPQDRDETIFEHKPFWVIADHLTREGIAVLRYDERGVGQSTGNFETATSVDFADDVRAAVQFLRNYPNIDTTQIGLIGHSEGGIVAPMVAAEDPEIAWIVMLAGTGVNGREIIFSQSRLIAAAEGADQQTLDRQDVMLEIMFEWLPKLEIGQSEPADVQAIAAEITRRILEIEAASDNELLAEEQRIDSQANQDRLTAEVTAMLKRVNNPWFRFFIEFEPGSVLRKISCPVLVLNGELDLQVDPKLNLPKIAEHLTAGGNTQFQIVELPKLNHLFQTSQTGSISEYEAIEETFAPIALETMTQWVKKQVDTARTD